jgi:hypothetical protein
MSKRAKVERETPEVAKAVGRMVRAVGRRIGREDPVDLVELRRLREALDEAERLAVEGLRERGFSWAEIGDGLGTTRQNAQQRFTRKGVK